MSCHQGTQPDTSIEEAAKLKWAGANKATATKTAKNLVICYLRRWGAGFLSSLERNPVDVRHRVGRVLEGGSFNSTRNERMYKKVCVMLGLVISMIIPTTTHAEASQEKQIRKYFASYPVLVSIARCESEFHHYDDNGRPLKNKEGSSATGAMQIIASIHRRAAARLGYDINTLNGNLGYAKHLYKTEGTNPWNPSKRCWG